MKALLSFLIAFMLALIITAVATVAIAEGAECSDYSEECMAETLYTMSPEQIDNMRFSIMAGAEFDLSITLAAICWQESDCGRDVVSNDGSYGLYQNHINSVVSRYEDEFGEMTDDERHMAERRLSWLLYSDRRYAAGQAIAEFQWWSKVFWGDIGSRSLRWKEALKSYNAGTKNKAGLPYFKKVNIKARVVRKHMSYIMNHNRIRRVSE